MKTYRYIPQNFDSSERIFISNINESKCRILKQYIQHWLSAGLGVSPTQYREFLVPCTNSWDIHPVNSADTENIYRIFAESNRGPMVIMLSNTICTQFHINPKYPETVQMLQNFVVCMSEKIYSEKVRMDVPLSRVSIGGYSKPIMKSAPQITLRVVQSGHHSIPFNMARHSGYAFSKRGGPVLVMNNATTVNTIKVTLEESEHSSSSDESSYSFEMKKKRSSGHSSPKSPRSPKRQRSRLPTVKPVLSFESKAVVSPITMPSKPLASWTKEDIREFLHPGYPVSSMPRAQTTDRSQSVLGKGVVKYVNSPFPYCRYRHFKTTSVAGLGSVSSRGEPGLLTDRPEESKQSKERWLGGNDFKRTFPSRTRQEVQTPFNLEPTAARKKPTFRETQREKWVAGVFRS